MNLAPDLAPRLAPILLLTYTRTDHLARTLHALKANELAAQSDLFIYSDGAASEKDVAAVEGVRMMLKSLTGFKSVTVIEQPVNRGLAANVIAGVTDMTERFGKVIVLEDDLMTSPYFLTFMNEALTLYQEDERVMNVQGHVLHTAHRMPESFFIRFTNSWGWGTWKRAWDQFEPDGRKLLAQLEERGLTREFDFGGLYPFTRMLRRQIAGTAHSWMIRWNATMFLKGGLALNAGRSLVLNIGTDGSGTNFTNAADYYTELDTSRPIAIDPAQPVKEDAAARLAIGKVYAHEYSKITKTKYLLRGIWRMVRSVL
ncbi:MAG: glycosyltransferase [Bacteroidales bacterium]